MISTSSPAPCSMTSSRWKKRGTPASASTTTVSGGWRGPCSAATQHVLMAVALAALVIPAGTTRMYTDCGGVVDGLLGTIQSPNFPGPFPLPINCRWVIHAPSDSKIVIYFPQYFLRHSFFITEYDHYTSPQDYDHKNSLGQISAEDHFTYLVSYRPFVVLDFRVTDASNINLRVEEFLRDVHGFNITYHVVPRHQVITLDTCSVHDCSYLGDCLASEDYSSYSCACFDGFYGRYCEKGPHCDPEKGKNMCLNGGKCRYFYGSLVNVCECPPDYNGPKCETKQEDMYKQDCTGLKCSHHCEQRPDTGALHCACDAGFQLADDGVSCAEEEYYRVTARLPVSDLGVARDKTINKTQAMKLLHIAGLGTVRDFAEDSVSNTSLIEFHFSLEKSELQLAAKAVKNLAHVESLFGAALDIDGLVVMSDPEMKLLSVESSDEGPTLEGKLMTLVCTARGSDNLRFRWFKDGRPFNMTLTHRNAWEIRLPETIGEKQISVLNIDGVTTYDTGEFTCEISDFGHSVNRSVLLDVLPYPQLVVTPLTVSVVKGSLQTFRCLAPDENQRMFEYSWTKNNLPITESDPESVEDLLPSGSRLVVKNAMVSTNYTCKVTNKAGTSSKTVFLFVADANISGLLCPEETMEGVKWTQAFGGFFNLQKCPTDAAEVNAHGSGDGSAKRKCECRGSLCRWGRPNYARCQSVYLIDIYDKLMKVQMGYQEDTLMGIYDYLYTIAKQARGRMFAGDLDITAKILYNIVTTARDFPPLANKAFWIEELVNFLSILLEEADTLSEDEKEELMVGGRIIQVTEIMVDLAPVGLINLTSATSSNLLDQKLITLQPLSDERINALVQHLKQETEHKEVESMHKHSHSQVEELSPRISRAVMKRKMPRPVMLMRYDHSILPFLHKGSQDRKPEEAFVADVVSYIPLKNARKGRKEKYIVDIPRKPAHTKSNTEANHVRCLSWERNKREATQGMWLNDTCLVIDVLTDVIKCLCPLPGHFTAVTVKVNQTTRVDSSGNSQLVLYLTFSISLAIMVLVLGVYLISWRQLSQRKHCIHFNFILSVGSINLVYLLCLFHPEKELMCIMFKMILQLFTMSAFTFLLLDVVQLLFGIYARNHSPIVIGTFKCVLTGWGIPTVTVLCVILLMALVGTDSDCHNWFWNTQSKHNLISILIPAVLLIVGHTVVLILCLVLVQRWTDEWRFRDRRKALLEMGRSEILLLLLVTFAVVGVLPENHQDVGGQVVFMIFDLSLCIAVVLLLCVFKKSIRLRVIALCLSIKSRHSKMGLTDFRDFVINGHHPEHARAEIERIHEYCDRVDRERYTSEHKRQLRFLLNSGSSSGSSGVACSPTPNSNLVTEGWNGTCGLQPNRLDRNLDSGISEGTESEKSSITPTQGNEGESQKNTNNSRNFIDRKTCDIEHSFKIVPQKKSSDFQSSEKESSASALSASKCSPSISSTAPVPTISGCHISSPDTETHDKATNKKAHRNKNISYDEEEMIQSISLVEKSEQTEAHVVDPHEEDSLLDQTKD